MTFDPTKPIDALLSAIQGDDPEMPDPIRPIGWLHSMILECRERGPRQDEDDPEAYWEMVREVEQLYAKIKSALEKP